MEPLFLNMYILFTQYTNEKVRHNTNSPDTSQFLEGTCIANLCKRPDLVESLEKMIEDLRNKALPVLQNAMQVPMARLQVAVYGHGHQVQLVQALACQHAHQASCGQVHQ